MSDDRRLQIGEGSAGVSPVPSGVSPDGLRDHTAGDGEAAGEAFIVSHEPQSRLCLNPERLSSFQLRTYSRLLIAHRFNLLRKVVGLLSSFDDNAKAMETIQDLLLSEDGQTQQNAMELTSRELRLYLEGYLKGPASSATSPGQGGRDGR